MCIAYISLSDSEWPVQIAANRDEFHARPTATLRPWDGGTYILAGRDLQAGGTWLGYGLNNKYAFLTNFREPNVATAKGALSRGSLVKDFLVSQETPYSYIKSLMPQAQNWAGFNLVIGNLAETWYLTNRNVDNSIDTDSFTDLLVLPNENKSLAGRLKLGDYVISNHLLDTNWPKSVKLKNRLINFNKDSWFSAPENIFQALHDEEKAELSKLPATGLSAEFELLLSSPFIISENYGTRCSSIITINNTGAGLFSETSFNNKGQAVERNDWPLFAATIET